MNNLLPEKFDFNMSQFLIDPHQNRFVKIQLLSKIWVFN